MKKHTYPGVLQAINLAFFSLSAGLIQALSFYLFHDVLGWESYWTSHVPSLVLSVIWNFTFNRRFTFHSTSNLPRAMSLVALYYLIFTPMSAWWGTLLENAGWHDRLIEAFNMVTNFVTEFIFQKFVVFRK